MLILIVEDDSSHNFLLTQLVRRDCKLEAISCFSVAGAKAVIESNSGVHAIVCDSNLTDGTALEVFELVKARREPIPFLLYSNDTHDLEIFRSDFFLGVVTKSDPKEVCRRILALTS